MEYQAVGSVLLAATCTCDDPGSEDTRGAFLGKRRRTPNLPRCRGICSRWMPFGPSHVSPQVPGSAASRTTGGGRRHGPGSLGSGLGDPNDFTFQSDRLLAERSPRPETPGISIAASVLALPEKELRPGSVLQPNHRPIRGPQRGSRPVGLPDGLRIADSDGLT